jgi:RNA polymerase sigma-70 factor (ECF subfamily)
MLVRRRGHSPPHALPTAAPDVAARARRVDDRILVGAATKGDLDAFEGLVRRYQAPVYRVALRMLGSDADAQDATQDTFVRAWQALGHFRGESSAGTWLYRIVTRRSLDVLAARRHAAVLDDRQPARAGDPAVAAELRQRLQAVTRELAALPPDQRAALVLREFEGLPYEQIAEILDTTIPAIKGRIHRARLCILQHTADW